MNFGHKLAVLVLICPNRVFYYDEKNDFIKKLEWDSQGAVSHFLICNKNCEIKIFPHILLQIHIYRINYQIPWNEPECSCSVRRGSRMSWRHLVVIHTKDSFKCIKAFQFVNGKVVHSKQERTAFQS